MHHIRPTDISTLLTLTLSLCFDRADTGVVFLGKKLILRYMKSFFIRVRNFKMKWLYKWFLRSYFFKQDPEDVHEQMLRWGARLGRSRFGRGLIKLVFGYSHLALFQRVMGIDFKNPVGLAAGFDKNGQLVEILGSVGFGFTEVGSITGKPCVGNKKPRLWRLVKEKSLAVHYGLKNDGASDVCVRLRAVEATIPFGISVAKTNSQETVDIQAGIDDYAIGVKEAMDVGSFLVINISCPNAFGGQPFHDKVVFDALFEKLDTLASEKPVLIKISPDLSNSEVDGIIEVARTHKVRGFVVANLSKKFDRQNVIDEMSNKRGGLSGKLVEERANELIGYIYKQTKGEFCIIGCGGIFSAEDAYTKIKLGANLVELITGMIYEGPQLISSVNEGLVRLLKKDGFTNIGEAVGAGQV